MAIPTGAVVAFKVAGDERTWEGWLASTPISVVCEGGTEANHWCVDTHTEPLGFYCVDIQIVSADWPYEDPHPQYGRGFALVPIANVLGVVSLPN